MWIHKYPKTGQELSIDVSRWATASQQDPWELPSQPRSAWWSQRGKKHGVIDPSRLENDTTYRRTSHLPKSKRKESPTWHHRRIQHDSCRPAKTQWTQSPQVRPHRAKHTNGTKHKPDASQQPLFSKEHSKQVKCSKPEGLAGAELEFQRWGKRTSLGQEIEMGTI